MSREFAFGQRDFDFLATRVREKTGIVLKPQKMDMVYGRIARRVRALGLDSVADYCKVLEGPGGDDETLNMVNAITTNLTSFFREPHHFEHLRDTALPWALKTNAVAKRLRIWSAGCSAGAEPYTIAMTCLDAVPQIASWDCRILATDIDTNVLNQARDGEYPEDWVKKIPDAQRKRHTDPAPNGGAVMEPALKDLIAFKQLNLMEGWPFRGPFDVIFCRNVLIYFDKDTQAMLFRRFTDMLRPGGYLYIGHSETLHGVEDHFDLLGRTTYRRKGET